MPRGPSEREAAMEAACACRPAYIPPWPASVSSVPCPRPRPAPSSPQASAGRASIHIAFSTFPNGEHSPCTEYRPEGGAARFCAIRGGGCRCRRASRRLRVLHARPHRHPVRSYDTGVATRPRTTIDRPSPSAPPARLARATGRVGVGPCRSRPAFATPRCTGGESSDDDRCLFMTARCPASAPGPRGSAPPPALTVRTGRASQRHVHRQSRRGLHGARRGQGARHPVSQAGAGLHHLARAVGAPEAQVPARCDPQGESVEPLVPQSRSIRIVRR